MATVRGGVILEVFRNNRLKLLESETINTPNHKEKGCFDFFGWISFPKRKKASTMQTDNMKYGILLTAWNL